MGTAEDKLSEFARRFEELSATREESLFLNPVSQLAYEISRHIEDESLSLDEVEDMILKLNRRAFTRRVGRLHNYVRTPKSATEEPLIEERLVYKDFADFAKRWSAPDFGLVFTAHPTFMLPPETQGKLARKEEEVPLTASDFALNEDLDLAYEHRFGQETLARTHGAVEKIHKRLINLARKKWPDLWRDFRPAALTLASWVGYDLDGRTDIPWQKAFRLRLAEKKNRLEGMNREWAGFVDSWPEDFSAEKGEKKKIADDIGATLTKILNKSLEDEAGFARAETDESCLESALSTLIDKSAPDLVSPVLLSEKLDKLIPLVASDDAAEALIRFRASLDMTGFGMARLHFRVNSTQIHNSLRALSGKMAVNAGLDRSSLAKLAEQIKTVKPMETGFTTLQAENITAIRQLVLIAQMVKYIDCDMPVRFLIAEAESAATVLGALYLIHAFGLADKVDISPLFETPAGIEHGSDIYKQLCRYDVFRDYVEKRGRVCIEAGFSDAGRFMGQIPAGLGIERLHIRLADIFQNSFDSSVDIVFFNTHGESMGRGAHPAGLEARQHYILTPRAREILGREGRHFIHEFSLQGGDGWLLMGSEELADTVLGRFFEIENRPVQSQDDIFYDYPDLIIDSFLQLKNFHEQLFNNPDYRSYLGIFGTNFLLKTGSRKVTRQYDYAPATLRGDPRQMRAIPHNALLQQLGFLANVTSGLGSVAIPDVERFDKICRESARMQNLTGFIRQSSCYGHADIPATYAMLLNSGFWGRRASGKGRRKEAFASLADLLAEDSRSGAVVRLVHSFRLDSALQEAFFERIDGLENRPENEKNHGEEKVALELFLLHAIRAALIMHIFILAALVPDFSTRDDLSRRRIFSMIFAMDIDQATIALGKAFPSNHKANLLSGLGEKTGYNPLEIDDYHRLDRDLIMPMRRIHGLIRKISIGIACFYGAYG